MLRIPWKGLKTKEFVHGAIKARVGPQGEVVGSVRRRELAWFGYTTRYESLTKMVLQRTIDSGRKRGRQAKCWTDNLKEWTRLDSRP